jgi:homospermidine synthase
MYFVYCPCDDAVNSMREVEMRGFKLAGMPQRIMTDEIVSGKDKLGILLLGHDYKVPHSFFLDSSAVVIAIVIVYIKINQAWWTGSLLSIDRARELAPHQNATSLQVAAGAIGGLLWAIKHPREGVLLPEQLPWKEVVDAIEVYLGEMRSGPVDWDPLSTRVDLYNGWNDEVTDTDLWQFCNFMVPGAPSCHF